MIYGLTAPTWGEEEIIALQRVIQSGQFTMSGEVAAFEREFADYFNMPYGVMVNSGSSANLIAIAALCHKAQNPLVPGDEVIVPAIAWATTYHPLHQYGLKLKIVDVDLATLNIDMGQVERALSPKTRAIMPVSILGNPAPLEEIRAVADHHGLYVVEDNCESMDAAIGSRKTGTYGDLNSFSFFFSHHISTMEGGMVLTRDLELYHLLRCLRAHGWTRDLPPGSPLYQRRDIQHFEEYRFILPGYNVRPIEFAGAVGREQLKKLPAMTKIRRNNHAIFQSVFAKDHRFIIQQEQGTTSSFSFTIILNPAHTPNREKVFAALREADIGFRMITGGCVTRHDVIRFYNHEVIGDLHNANLAHDFGFFVGNHPYDLTDQIERLYRILDKNFL